MKSRLWRYISRSNSRPVTGPQTVYGSPVFRLPTLASVEAYALSRPLTTNRPLSSTCLRKPSLAPVGRLQGKQSQISSDSIHLRSSLGSSTILVTSVVLAAGIAVALVLTQGTQEHSSQPVDEQDSASILVMSTPIPEGRPGNLTAEQEEKLQKLWNSVFQLTGVLEGGDPANPAEEIAAVEEPHPAEGEKKKRFGMFRKNKDTKTPDSSSKDGADDDKYGQTKQYYETLANHSPETIRETIWAMVKHDHPDALLLRFLRARKWDVEKALVMLVSTMSWRHSEMHVDDDIMKNGEGGAVQGASSADAAEKRLGTDFMAQIRMGKSFLHGKDKQGRPICVVRVRLHKQGEQCEESLERYTVYLIETARMVLAPPVDTANIIFDMTGFSMANMDYTPVKFMIKCFEANYPESLGAVLVHNAPWVFQGIWKIIRGWLDPVVAAKVHFTNNRSDLENFIPSGQILKELGGDENWEYEYIEPVPGENDRMKDTETKFKLQEARAKLVKDFEAVTVEWTKKPQGAEATRVRDQRNTIVSALRENYWKLDPYVRARSLYDRQGMIREGGSIDFYPTKVPANNTPAVETSADDVD